MARRVPRIALILGLGALGAFAGAPAAQASVCDQGTLAGRAEQPFLPWGDANRYLLAPGGDFESGARGWRLDDGANLSAGGSALPGGSSPTALSLPVGSSAVSPPICVDSAFPHARMAAVTVSAEGQRPGLRVRAQVVGSDGETAVTTVAGLPSWDASPELALPDLAKAGIEGPVAIRIKLNPVRRSGWLIDDLYVDPRART